MLVQMLVTKIISGGQTGVDRGALEAARELGFQYGGLIPKGRRAEATKEDLAAGRREGVVPLEFDRMEVSVRKDYLFRTEWNVSHSDATLVIARRGRPLLEGEKGCHEFMFLGPTNADYLEGGTKRTVEFCHAHQRPCLVLFDGNLRRALEWLRMVRSELTAAHGERCPFVLNVAGPRESKAPGIQAATRSFVKRLIEAVVAAGSNLQGM